MQCAASYARRHVYVHCGMYSDPTYLVYEFQGLKVGEALLRRCVCLSQVVKQQQMDENNRLRATLEEWSHRNAKWALR